MKNEIKKTGRVISWFSCGAASATATKLAIQKYGDSVEVFYTDTGSEHPDNKRFLKDCENWFGRNITILKSDKYADIWDVFKKKRFLSSPSGAPCTGVMKKEPANGIWKIGDVEVFGYTSDERHRLERWQKDNPERIIECPLIDNHLDKNDCLGMLDRVGIDLPEMYRLGFRNNNCIGCVKARDSIDYWKRVRLHFPDQFAEMANLEKELGYVINRVTIKGERISMPLSEIPPGEPKGQDPKISCGLFCMAQSDQFQ